MEEDQEGRRRRSGGGGRWKGGRDRWKRRRVVASSHLSPAVRLVSVFVEVDDDAAAGVYEGPPGGVLPRQPGRLDAHVVLQIAEPRPPARVDDVGDAHPSLLHDHVVQAVQREATVRRHEATTQRALPAAPSADEDERGRGRARGRPLGGARARGRTPSFPTRARGPRRTRARGPRRTRAPGPKSNPRTVTPSAEMSLAHNWGLWDWGGLLWGVGLGRRGWVQGAGGGGAPRGAEGRLAPKSDDW